MDRFRRVLFILTVVLIAALALVACDDDDDDNDANNTDDTITTEDADTNEAVDVDNDGDSESDETNLDAPVRLMFSNADDTGVGFELETNEWIIQQIDGMYTMLLNINDGDYTVTFSNIPNDITPGTYAIAEDGITASVKVGQVADEDTVFYEHNVDGELTITDVEDVISGAFAFTAYTQDDAGNPTDDYVEAQGIFVNEPLPGGSEN